MPIVPLNFKLCAPGKGSLRLFDFGLVSSQTTRLFRTDGAPDPHSWINRLNFSRGNTGKRVAMLIVESLIKPTAFGVRLLDPANPEFSAVDEFFSAVIRPVVEDEFGFQLTRPADPSSRQGLN